MHNLQAITATYFVSCRQRMPNKRDYDEEPADVAEIHLPFPYSDIPVSSGSRSCFHRESSGFVQKREADHVYE